MNMNKATHAGGEKILYSTTDTTPHTYKAREQKKIQKLQQYDETGFFIIILKLDW